MRAYFNMPTSEFVGQLRDIAIKADARPQVIDCLDALAEKSEFNEGKDYTEGYVAMHEECVSALRRGLGDPDIGLTETQIEQVLELVKDIKP